MPRILLDGVAIDLSPAPATWADALRTFDDHLAPQGRIVTDVRFDGLDDAAFREPETLDRPLADVSIVEVLSGTPTSLMDRCLGEAIAAVPPLCTAAVQVGDRYRARDVMRGNEGLLELADGLTSLIGIVGAAGLAFHVDLRDVRCGDKVAATVVSELGTCLETLITAQESGDWGTVADLLQRDVEPSLRRLAPALESLRQGQPVA